MNLCIALGLLLAICAIGDADDCVWGKWGRWSKCSKKCGGGVEYRSRKCEGEHGGSCKDYQCGDQYKIKRDCNKKPCCTVKWGPWGSWGKCRKCHWTRKRSCIKDGCKGKKGKCKPKKAGSQKEKCKVNCDWEKTGKYLGDCEIDEHGHCVKYPEWECVCDPKNCGGSCKTERPHQYELCDADECCECDWEKTGKYSDCEIDVHGHCVKYPEWKCKCDPKGCGECDTPEPHQYELCKKKDCCFCDWVKTGHYTECEIDKHGHCVKYPKWKCECDPKECGECDTPEPHQYELCEKEDCCVCEWGKWGECHKHDKYNCRRERQCICPNYCTGKCKGKKYMKCEC